MSQAIQSVKSISVAQRVYSDSINIKHHFLEVLKLSIKDDKSEVARIFLREIAAFIKNTYGVKFPSWQFYYIVKGLAKPKAENKRVKPKDFPQISVSAGRKEVGKIEDAGTIIKGIYALLDELQVLYIDNLKAIRVQLLAAVQKLRKTTEE